MTFEPARPTAENADPPTLVDGMRTFRDGAWARRRFDLEAQNVAAVAAVLKAGGELPIRRVRLASMLVLEAGLLFSHEMSRREAAQWRRLTQCQPDPRDATYAAEGWSAAVRRLRGLGLLIEDLDAETWAPSDELAAAFDTEGWPDGRASVVLEVLRREDDRRRSVQVPS